MSKSFARAALATAVIAAAGLQPALAATETVLYHFADRLDGGFPHGGVVADPQGNLYGTTSTGGGGIEAGTVYRLVRSKDGKSYKFEKLHTFGTGSDGINPEASLLRTKNGHLYGTTIISGNNGFGVVYELVPPKKGQTTWAENILWTFSGGADGSKPTGALIMDDAGNLYGTTRFGGSTNNGVVFELSPPSAGQTEWTQTVLHSFEGGDDGGVPEGRLLLGSDGNLYGTTAGWGKFDFGGVFKMTANGNGQWDYSVLHAFKGGSDGAIPLDGLVQGPDGTLYGATAGFDTFGNVYSVQPDGSGYKVLWKVKGGQGFQGSGPSQALSIDSKGVLYGTTFANGVSAGGEVFSLTPPAKKGGAWKAKVLKSYEPGPDGSNPDSSVLVMDDGLYGTTNGFADENNFWPGTVWHIVP